MIELAKHEYYRCFNKYKEGNTIEAYQYFDNYELYPLLFSITPLEIRIKQRIDFFKSNCYHELYELDEPYDADFKQKETEDGFILTFYNYNKIFKQVKLLKNNKVDFSYDEAVYSTGEEDYKENLYEKYIEFSEAMDRIDTSKFNLNF